MTKYEGRGGFRPPPPPLLRLCLRLPHRVLLPPHARRTPRHPCFIFAILGELASFDDNPLSNLPTARRPPRKPTSEPSANLPGFAVVLATAGMRIAADRHRSPPPTSLPLSSPPPACASPQSPIPPLALSSPPSLATTEKEDDAEDDVLEGPPPRQRRRRDRGRRRHRRRPRTSSPAVSASP